MFTVDFPARLYPQRFCATQTEPHGQETPSLHKKKREKPQLQWRMHQKIPAAGSRTPPAGETGLRAVDESEDVQAGALFSSARRAILETSKSQMKRSSRSRVFGYEYFRYSSSVSVDPHVWALRRQAIMQPVRCCFHNE